LNGSNFRTRDTHAKIYAACAFPFTIANGDTYKGDTYFKLVGAIKKLQDWLLDRVLQRAIDYQHDFTIYDRQSETQPDSDSAIIQSFRATHPEPIMPPILPQLPDMRVVSAIKIPQAGLPELCQVTLYKITDWKGVYEIYDSPIEQQDSDYWVADFQIFNEKQSPKDQQKKWFCTRRIDYTNILSDIRNTGCILAICFGNEELPEDLPCNEWCLNNLNTSSTGKDRDDVVEFVFRGDLYMFLGYTRVMYHSDLSVKAKISATEKEDLLKTFTESFLGANWSDIHRGVREERGRWKELVENMKRNSREPEGKSDFQIIDASLKEIIKLAESSKKWITPY